MTDFDEPLAVRMVRALDHSLRYADQLPAELRYNYLYGFVSGIVDVSRDALIREGLYDRDEGS